jgi:hypothetical protein
MWRHTVTAYFGSTSRRVASTDSRRRVRLTATISVALLGVAITGGLAVAASRPSSGHTRGVVVFLGDSNETIPASAIADALLNRDYGYVFVNTARPGATIRTADCHGTTDPCPTYNYWQARVGDVRKALRPDAWVIDLGINDTVRAGTVNGPGYAQYGMKVDWLMSKLGGTRVYWTNLPCTIEPKNRATGCRAVNDALAQATTRHTNLRLLDWSKAASGHREYLGQAGTFWAVHLTQKGQRAWAKLITARLDGAFAAPH